MARERYLLNAGEETIHSQGVGVMSKKEKWKNWWYYHKIHLLLAAVAVILVGSFAYTWINRERPDYMIGLVTSYTMPSSGVEELERCITQYADDRNGDGEVVVTVSNYALATEEDLDATQQQASIVRFTADAATNGVIIYLHDEGGFNFIKDSLGGYFQYNDGTAMPEDATDFENAMTPWSDLKGLASFTPEPPADDNFDSEMLTRLYEQLRVSLRTTEGTTIVGNEEEMDYYNRCMELFERIKNDEKINGETQSEEG